MVISCYPVDDEYIFIQKKKKKKKKKTRKKIKKKKKKTRSINEENKTVSSVKTENTSKITNSNTSITQQQKEIQNQENFLNHFKASQQENESPFEISEEHQKVFEELQEEVMKNVLSEKQFQHYQSFQKQLVQANSPEQFLEIHTKAEKIINVNEEQTRRIQEVFLEKLLEAQSKGNIPTDTVEKIAMLGFQAQMMSQQN